MWPDFINGLYESLAGLFVLNHCRVLLKHKQVKGVSIASIVFFTSWGFWNLFYYPHLGQVFSFLGGLFIVLANCFYVYLLFRYKE